MLWFMLASVYFVLLQGTLSVIGQCMISSDTDSDLASEENLQRIIEEHDHSMRSSFDKKMQTMQDQLQTMNETLSSAIDQINERLNAILDRVNENLPNVDYCRNTSVVCDCSDIKANGYRTSGVYSIYVDHEGKRHCANTYCDMTTTNGGWTVFQTRKDGSVDFYREWNDYEHGFGNPNGEFWLGNNLLHLLASKRRYRLRVDLEDFEGVKRYAEYSTFSISSSADKYKLTTGSYSGTAGNCLSHHNGRGFTTRDSDNDDWSSGNLAVKRSGAWWYYLHDIYTNLNGLYLRGHYSSNGSFDGLEGIHWYPWHYQWYSLKTTEMKISSSY